MRSKMLQLKISKTKKRLSENHLEYTLVFLAIMGFVGILSFSMRVTSISWDFGIVKAKIPVMDVSLQDPFVSRTKPRSIGTIGPTTLTIVLADEGFYFGNLNSFSTGFINIKNKFLVPHHDGRPQIGNLIKSLREWKVQQEELYKIKFQPIAVLIPEDHWPGTIVLQIVHYLKTSEMVDHVVLGGGMI